LRELDPAGDDAVARLAGARVAEPEHKRVGAGVGEPPAVTALDAGVGPAVAEARLE
jgi:hypothetical protein